MQKNTSRPLFPLFNGFTLKIAMAILMVMDHLYLAFPTRFPAWFHMASRMVAPVFVFLVTEGLVYTRNREAYARRMLVFGLAMWLGNSVLELLFGTPIRNSILISLAISAFIITSLDRAVQEGRPLYFGVALALLYLSLFFEGALLCPVIALVFYYLRDNRAVMVPAYIAASFALCKIFFTLPGNSLFAGTQWGMIFAVIPIVLYGGERGPNGMVAKYFFYLFYPLHIWLIYLWQHIVIV